MRRVGFSALSGTGLWLRNPSRGESLRCQGKGCGVRGETVALNIMCTTSSLLVVWKVNNLEIYLLVAMNRPWAFSCESLSPIHRCNDGAHQALLPRFHGMI